MLSYITIFFHEKVYRFYFLFVSINVPLLPAPISVSSINGEKKEVIWLSPITKALTRAENSKKRSDNTKNADKNFDHTTIADRLKTVSWSDEWNSKQKSRKYQVVYEVKSRVKASSRNLVSTIGAQASPKMEVRNQVSPAGMPHALQMLHGNHS